MPISTIVVGADHSDRSDNAMRKANEIALFHDAGVVVEYALDVGSSQKPRGLLERVALEETEERAQLTFGDQAARFEVQAAAGRPHEILRDVSKQCGADLMVLGVHRRDKSPTLFAGSTARRLIDDAPPRCWWLRPNPPAPTGASLSAMMIVPQRAKHFASPAHWRLAHSSRLSQPA